jgi:hypothetical protein
LTKSSTCLVTKKPTTAVSISQSISGSRPIIQYLCLHGQPKRRHGGEVTLTPPGLTPEP